MLNFLLDFTIRSRSRTILLSPPPVFFLEWLWLQLLVFFQPAHAPAPGRQKQPAPAPQTCLFKLLLNYF